MESGLSIQINLIVVNGNQAIFCCICTLRIDPRTALVVLLDES